MTNERIDAIKAFLRKMTGAELNQVRELLDTDWMRREAYFKEQIDNGVASLKRAWGDFDADENERFYTQLETLFEQTRTTWRHVDQLEMYQKGRTQADIRTSLQKAVDDGLTFERAVIDGFVFQLEDGQVVTVDCCLDDPF